MQKALFRKQPGVVSRALAKGIGRLGVARARRAASNPIPPLDGARVIVVGALAVAGAGRTAIVTSLAEWATGRGISVGIVGHGYGGRHVGPVTTPDWQAFGDEAVAMRARLDAQVQLEVGDRFEAIHRMSRTTDLVLVDGGLHSRSVPRHLTIAVVDATAPRRVMPAGPLRAPMSTLRGADLIWLHKVDEAGAQPLSTADVESVLVLSYVEVAGNIVDADWLSGRSVVPFIAIGRPDSFLETLAQCGAILGGRPRIHRDHQPFSAADLAGVPPGSWPVTTAKDAARMPSNQPRMVVVHVAVKLTRGHGRLDEIWRDVCSA